MVVRLAALSLLSETERSGGLRSAAERRRERRLRQELELRLERIPQPSGGGLGSATPDRRRVSRADNSTRFRLAVINERLSTIERQITLVGRLASSSPP
jgi:hypothetical protein